MSTGPGPDIGPSARPARRLVPSHVTAKLEVCAARLKEGQPHLPPLQGDPDSLEGLASAILCVPEQWLSSELPFPDSAALTTVSMGSLTSAIHHSKFRIGHCRKLFLGIRPNVFRNRAKANSGFARR